MNPFKALILGFLLLVPILIFIFISVFGTHHFSLKTFYPKLDDVGGVVYNAAGDTVFQQVPYFELPSLRGDTVKQSDLDESVYVTSFLTETCADTCRIIFSQLVRVQEAFENNPQVKLVSVGVRGGANNLQELQSLAEEYKLKDGKWYLLTGDEGQVLSLAADGFHEPYKTQNAELKASRRLVLVDKEKKIRGVYNGTDAADVDRLILEINVLLDEYSKRK